MKKLQLVLIIYILTIFGVCAQSAGNSRYLKPTNFQKRSQQTLLTIADLIILWI